MCCEKDDIRVSMECDVKRWRVETCCCTFSTVQYNTVIGAHDAIDILNDLQSSSIGDSTIFRSGRWVCGSQRYPSHFSNDFRIELNLE